MKHQLKTIRQALESYLGSETDGMNGSFRNCCSTRPHEPHSNCEAEAALAALTQLEAMVEEQATATPSVVTDAMVDTYLNANDAYWRETDAQPKSSTRWRNGNVKEATRVSLIAAMKQGS